MTVHMRLTRGSNTLLSAPDQGLERRSASSPRITHYQRGSWHNFQSLTQHVQLVTALLVRALLQTKEFVGSLMTNAVYSHIQVDKEHMMEASQSLLAQGTASGEDIERYEVIDGVRVER